MTYDSAGSGLVIICVDYDMGELYDWGEQKHNQEVTFDEVLSQVFNVKDST